MLKNLTVERKLYNGVGKFKPEKVGNFTPEMTSTNYEDLFKGPSYDYILLRIRQGNMKTYQDSAYRSANNFINYLKNN